MVIGYEINIHKDNTNGIKHNRVFKSYYKINIILTKCIKYLTQIIKFAQHQKHDLKFGKTREKPKIKMTGKRAIYTFSIPYPCI